MFINGTISLIFPHPAGLNHKQRLADCEPSLPNALILVSLNLENDAVLFGLTALRDLDTHTERSDTVTFKTKIRYCNS